GLRLQLACGFLRRPVQPRLRAFAPRPQLAFGLLPPPFSGTLPAISMAPSAPRRLFDTGARSAHGQRWFEHRDDAGGANRHIDAARWSRERGHPSSWPRSRARQLRCRESETRGRFDRLLARGRERSRIQICNTLLLTALGVTMGIKKTD